MTKFKVTEKAMRPASEKRECFYCKQPIGSHHKDNCVLVNKKFILLATIQYEIDLPADWNEEDVAFHFNEGTWCSDNIIRDLEAFQHQCKLEGKCMCMTTKIKMVTKSKDSFLKE